MNAPDLMARAQHKTIVVLDEGAVYRAPSGRLCRWRADGRDAAAAGSYASFVYADAAGRVPAGYNPDGFVLACANWYLLRRLS